MMKKRLDKPNPIRAGGTPRILEPVSKTTPHLEAPFAARKRPRRMLQEAPNSALWNVLRGRFAAPQDEGAGFLGQALSSTESRFSEIRPALGFAILLIRRNGEWGEDGA